MGLSILAEALARVEHKLDILLRETSFPEGPPRLMMHFVGNQCPVCMQMVDYQIDVQHQVVARRCGCSTGKIPSAIPLLPVAQAGASNGYPTTDDQERSDGAEESVRRKAGGTRPGDVHR